MKGDITRALQFNKTFRYIDDLLCVNNDNFNKHINEIYLDSNVPRNPAYGVYISRLVRYARICSRKDDFIYRHRRLSLKLHEVVSQILQKSLRRVKEVWNNADGTTIFDLKRSPCRVYPFELYLNLFLMCAWLCFYFLSLFYVLFVARAFSYFLFARACIIVMYIQLTLDAYFILTVVILFSLPILTFVQ